MSSYFLSLSLFCKKEKEKESSKEREREKTLINLYSQFCILFKFFINKHDITVKEKYITRESRGLRPLAGSRGSAPCRVWDGVPTRKMEG